MKIQIKLKDPDALYEAVNEALEKETFGLTDPDEIEAVKEKRKETLMAFCGEWTEYGEYFTIEFDTELKTARILREDELKN